MTASKNKPRQTVENDAKCPCGMNLRTEPPCGVIFLPDWTGKYCICAVNDDGLPCMHEAKCHEELA